MRVLSTNSYPYFEENGLKMIKAAISLKPHLKQASTFIDYLTGRPNAVVCFQVIPERLGSRGFPWSRHGTLEEMAPRLIRAQHEGCGVFVVVNDTDGQGRKAANIKNVRASFVDLDQPGLPHFEVDPDLIVQTSHNRHHAYWLLLPDENLERASVLQVRMASYYNGDLTVCDPSRVMRLPGFWHQKGDPFLVKLVHACPEEDASMNGFGRRFMEVLEEKHPCSFGPPRFQPAEERVEAPPAGWDNDADVRHAIRYLKNDASPAIEGRNGDYTTFTVACSLRDRGISERCAFDLMSDHYNDRCSPPWSDDELLNKVENAYAYAKGDAGSNSIASDFAEDPDFSPELSKDVVGPI